MTCGKLALHRFAAAASALLRVSPQAYSDQSYAEASTADGRFGMRMRARHGKYPEC